MSMISSLIDELRKSADGQVTYRDAREVMLEAADTIWELRDDLQRVNTENAKLRQEFDKMDKWHSAELTAAMDENARLRECLQDLAEHIRDDDGFGLDYGWMLDRIREVVEVDG